MYFIKESYSYRHELVKASTFVRGQAQLNDKDHAYSYGEALWTNMLRIYNLEKFVTVVLEAGILLLAEDVEKSGHHSGV